MIELKTISVSGFDGAIQGMRYPMNSDNLSDSYYLCAYDDVGVARPYEFRIGAKDLELAKKLANAGSDHGKFLRMIHVQVSINAPHFWWPELDTYKVATVTNSRSKMHKLLSREFKLDDFSFEDVSIEESCAFVDMLNRKRDNYLLEENPEKKKRIWRNILETLPLSYNQERVYDVNYATLRNIYHARKSHKLSEWHKFCEWIETLPYAKELIMDEP